MKLQGLSQFYGSSVWIITKRPTNNGNGNGEVPTTSQCGPVKLKKTLEFLSSSP
jgi:hypothetical protein